MKVTMVGIDLVKNVFSVHGVEYQKVLPEPEPLVSYKKREFFAWCHLIWSNE